jgi:hypothetical protein
MSFVGIGSQAGAWEPADFIFMSGGEARHDS